MTEEGEKLLDDLGAIFDQAQFVATRTGTIYANLDGDEETDWEFLLDELEYRPDGEAYKGLEVVRIYQEGETRRLVADVYTGHQDEPERVVLTSYLDNDAEKPFVTWYVETSGEVDMDKINVSVTLKKDGESKIFKRTYTLGKPSH